MRWTAGDEEVYGQQRSVAIMDLRIARKRAAADGAGADRDNELRRLKSGISMWLPRSRTTEAHVESAFNLTMSGTWYGQNAGYDIRPDGASTVFNVGNYICGKAEWSQGYDNSQNQSNGVINMNPGTAAATLRPTLVE